MPKRACLCSCSENTPLRSPEKKEELSTTWKSVFTQRKQNIQEESTSIWKPKFSEIMSAELIFDRLAVVVLGLSVFSVFVYCQ
jgi:hypothetical protein